MQITSDEHKSHKLSLTFWYIPPTYYSFSFLIPSYKEFHHFEHCFHIYVIKIYCTNTELHTSLFITVFMFTLRQVFNVFSRFSPLSIKSTLGDFFWVGNNRPALRHSLTLQCFLLETKLWDKELRLLAPSQAGS